MVLSGKGGLQANKTLLLRQLVHLLTPLIYSSSVLTYEGGKPIGNLGIKKGSIGNPNGMSFRPGFYAPSSKVILPLFPDDLVAGVPLSTPLVLHDVYNSNITATAGKQPEISRFAVTAESYAKFDGGITALVTVRGTISQLTASELSSELVLRTAGSWNITVREEGVAVPSHFRGSPFKVFVNPSITSPKACKAFLNNSTVYVGHSSR